MSAFGTDFTSSALGVIYEMHGVSVTYLHSQTSAADSDSQTYTAIPQTTGDVAGGSRAQQQPVLWRVRDAGLTRAPDRGDRITYDGDTWTVVDAVLKRGGAEWRLTCQYDHTRG